MWLWIAVAHAACVPAELGRAVLELRRALGTDDHRRGDAVYREAAAGLSCADDFFDPVELVALHQLGALVAERLGDTSAREERLRAAAVLDPDQDFDPTWAAEGRELLLPARSRAKAEPPGELFARSDVRVDGEALAAGARRALVPGTHYVQWATGASVVTAPVLVIGDGTEPVGPVPRRGPSVGDLVGGALLGAGLGIGAAGVVALVQADERARVLDEAVSAEAAALVNAQAPVATGTLVTGGVLAGLGLGICIAW